MINWYLIEAIKPPANTHLLTTSNKVEAATIFHNITDSDSRFTLDAVEMNGSGIKHKPTHWAYMNFPSR